jgi:DNA-binding transcriptional ArsR family regulator
VDRLDHKSLLSLCVFVYKNRKSKNQVSNILTSLEEGGIVISAKIDKDNVMFVKTPYFMDKVYIIDNDESIREIMPLELQDYNKLVLQYEQGLKSKNFKM